jgi:predicted phage terminase large subunit-like protein
MSSYGFAALYQQRPSPEEGGEFKRAWMQRWASLPPDRLNERGQRQKTRWRVFQAVDSSWDEGVAHDYSVIATWATDGRDYFVLDLWRGRVEYPDLIKAIRRTYRNQRFQPRLILIEDAANGRPVIQTLKREGFPVKGITPVGSKEQRADDVTPAFESMHVYLPPDAEWVEDWIEEHVTFPNATHDDQVDTTSLALGYMMPKPAALLPNRTLGGRARATQAV